ncbi:MAG: FMN-binding protein [Eudoraea sp.]|uniref:FMN-binding protein n=1 Tax=Eudoraea sp. TaxID=1979955 RepID=UPI00326455D9
MNTKVKNKKICLVLILLLPLTWNCREKAVVEHSLKEANVTKQISPELKELLEFAKISFADTTKLSSLLVFKLIDENDDVIISDSETTTKIYKNIIKGRSTSSLPIFEIIGSDKVILAVQNRGFSGSIWAKILIDNNRKEILGLQFKHKAESEGYGAGITQEPYESQFVGKVFQTDLNDFGLKQNGVSLIKGNTMIDGISGSTITCKATVEMINQGFQKYQSYLDQPL